LNRNHTEAGDNCGFGSIFRRDKDADAALLAGTQGNRQNAFNRPNRAGEGEFPDHDEVVQLIGLKLLAGSEHADGDRQIKTWSFLFYVCGREIDRRAAKSKSESGIDESGHDPIARFLDRGIGQANDHNDSVAVTRVNLDLDRVSLDAIDGGGTDLGQHGSVMGYRLLKGKSLSCAVRPIKPLCWKVTDSTDKTAACRRQY